MSKYTWLNERRRHRQLFIVEGKYEKDILLNLLINCFPELNINIDDVIIYGTNIYQLYDDICKEFSEDWYEQDVDLPLLVSKKKNSELLYKRDFTNILIIFDYERHHIGFNEEKIEKMQNYFNEITDVGQLYINYPMFESYQDFSNIPDNKFIDKKIPSNLQPGHIYKNSVKDKYITKLVNVYKKINIFLDKKGLFDNNYERYSCIERILSIDNNNNFIDKIESILKKYLSDNDICEAKNYIGNILNNFNYLSKNESYYSLMRKIFQYIIRQNLIKAYKIQAGLIEKYKSLREILLELQQIEILKKQNKCSRDLESGFIWVLNTFILFIPEYNLSLIE